VQSNNFLYICSQIAANMEISFHFSCFGVHTSTTAHTISNSNTMIKLSIYLLLDGTCKPAMEFYGAYGAQNDRFGNRWMFHANN
jgi:hypothetical protein